MLCVVIVGMVSILVRVTGGSDLRAAGMVCIGQGSLHFIKRIESTILQPQKIRSCRVSEDRVLGCAACPDEYNTQRGGVGDNVIFVLNARQCVVDHLVCQTGELKGDRGICWRISSAVPLNISIIINIIDRKSGIWIGRFFPAGDNIDGVRCNSLTEICQFIRKEPLVGTHKICHSPRRLHTGH